LDGLEISVISDCEEEHSRWIKITTFDPTAWEFIGGDRLQAKVTGGTLTSHTRDHFGILLEWRVQ